MVSNRDINYRRGRGGRPFRRLKQRVYATETHCCICGLPVDLDLPYRDPYTGQINGQSKSIEHAIELDAGGHPYDGHLAHLSCNASKGGRYVQRKKRHLEQIRDELNTSPDYEG